MPAAYAASIAEFLEDPLSKIQAALVDQIPVLGFQQLHTAQIPAWKWQIEILQQELKTLSADMEELKQGGILLEFPIPRRQKRIDTILLIRDLIFVLEFKSGLSNSSGLKQAEDYAADLADFHLPSRNMRIFPLAIASGTFDRQIGPYDTGNGVFRGVSLAPEQLAKTIAELTREYSG